METRRRPTINTFEFLFQSETRAKYKNYFKNNRAVKDMIVDYIKEILIIKPENVLQFSIDYFDVR